MGVLYDVYGERKYAQVREETWGHLAPEPRRGYAGWMVFARAGYEGVLVLIDAAFEGLDDSPWLYEDMMDYADDHAPEGKVCRFEGTYTRFKNGGHRFSGRIREVPIAPPGAEEG